VTLARIVREEDAVRKNSLSIGRRSSVVVRSHGGPPQAIAEDLDQVLGSEGGITMAADENVAIMRRAYEAFNTGDMDTLTELMDETVWHLPGRSSMAGDYEGSGATLAYFGQIAQETGGTFRAELQHIAADGEDRVVGIQRSTADRNGKHLDVADCIVFELRDGKVTDGREHFEDLYAWDEFWS
jgi:uncharacterized protein